MRHETILEISRARKKQDRPGSVGRRVTRCGRPAGKSAAAESRVRLRARAIRIRIVIPSRERTFTVGRLVEGRVRSDLWRTLPFVIRALLSAALLVSGLAAAQPCAWPSFALPVDLGIPVEERWPQLRTAEVDGDGRQDLLAIFTSGQVVVFWNRAGGLVRGPSTEQLPGSASRLFLEPADLNGDGRSDLLVGVSSFGAPPRRFESWLGDGAGGFSKAASVTLPAGLDSGLTLARFDGGASLDVLSVARSASDASKLEVVRWRGRGDGSFQAPATILTLDNPIADAGPGGVVAGDVDGDGTTDLIVSSIGSVPSHPEVHPSSSYVSKLWLGDGAGGFEPSSPAPFGWAFRLVDVDGDGRDEVLYANWQQMPVISDSGFLRREADGTWRALGTWLASAQSLVVGDLDRNPERKEVLVGGGAYRFGEAGSGAVQFAAIPETVQPTLLDLDSDGHLDVLGVARDPVGTSGRLVLARSVCGGGPGTTTLFLPAFLSLTGAEATHFETEVTVTNFGASAISAVLRIHPADGAPESDLASFTLGPRRIRLLSTTEDPEAVRIVMPEGVDRGTATLEVSTLDGSQQDVVVDVRILSERPGSGCGGVGYRARAAEGQRVGATGYVSWLKEDAEDRTNLAVASAGPEPVALRVSVVSADPERPGRVVLPDVTLTPYGSHQWNRVLEVSGLGARSGWAHVERLAGGPWTAWATVNSNGTGDGSVVEAAASLGGRLLPAIIGTDRYRTDVVITNTAATSGIASLDFPPVSDPGGLPFPVTLDIEAGPESSRLVDPVSALRDTLEIPPGPYVGHATFHGSGLVAGARVTTVSASSGSFGVYTPPASWFDYGESMLVSGLRQDQRNRSNLAIVESPTMSPSRYRIELFDGRTGTLAKAIDGVTPGATHGMPSRVQLDSVLWGTGVPFGWARVTRTSSFNNPFFVYAVVNDGASAGLGSGDGTYLPGIPR